MRRRLVILGSCLLAGAVINVLVAWVIGALVDPNQGDLELDYSSPPWRYEPHELFPDGSSGYRVIGHQRGRWMSVSFYTHEKATSARGIDDRKEFWTASLPGTPSRPAGFLEMRYGWPTRSMRLAIPIETFDALAKGALEESLKAHSVWLVGIRSPVADGTQPEIQRIPLRPLFQGIVINTLVYSIAVWVLVSVPITVRRVHRRRRGRCVRCAYQLGGLTTCPECGSAA